jgi:hypothetical protein
MRNIIIQAGVALLAISMVVIGFPVTNPDDVHTEHGLPLTWGVHQFVTIVGPVDTWRVNVINLGIDLVIWFGLVLITPLIAETYLSSDDEFEY